MAEGRPFPPSPRRVALARRAGLTAASPLLVGGVACAALLVATLALARVAAVRIAAAIAAACAGHAALAATDLTTTVLELALPLVIAAAAAAILAQLVQTRAVWLPRRRRIPGAPQPPPERVRSAALELVAAATIATVAFAWLWLFAPRLAALPSVPLAAAALIASALAAFAVAWIVCGAIDALLRHAALTHTLRMTPAEKREDDRLAGADPRWQRARRRAAARAPSLLGATLLLLGDDLAVAIAWDPRRRPIPERVATGRRAHATQLLGLARRHRIPVHRDAALAAALVEAPRRASAVGLGKGKVEAHEPGGEPRTEDGTGRVPEAHWPRLAEIVAALRYGDGLKTINSSSPTA